MKEKRSSPLNLVLEWGTVEDSENSSERKERKRNKNKIRHETSTESIKK